MVHRYRPGQSVSRSFGGYGPVEEAKYQILADLAYSVSYGFAATRLPTPGACLPERAIYERAEQVVEAWRGETPRSIGTRPWSLDELGPNHIRHLAERLLPYPRMAPPLTPAGIVTPNEEWE